MNKIKKLTWFAAFCSLFQYTRERKIGGYLLANAFSCVVPALLLVLLTGGQIHWAACIGINALARLLFAPLDAYTSDEYAYCKLEAYPLSIFEKLYVRLIAKATQISEWLFAAAVAYVYIVAFPGIHWALTALLTVVTLLAIQISEELVFYLVYLVKNIKPCVAGFVAACIGIGVVLVLNQSVATVSWIVTTLVFASVLALSVVGAMVLYVNRLKIHVIARNAGSEKQARIPLSTRLVMGAAGGSALNRLVRLEWVTMLKLKIWDMISALGYVVVFSAMDHSGSALYILVQYFIVDYCFLAGFNYFGTIEDRSGLFLFSTVDRKTQIRSKNLALGSILLVGSTLLTLVLGLLKSMDPKTLLLTMAANVFCSAVMVLCASIVSITHFHLNSSRKKYTVSNLVIMLLALVLCSIVTAFLFGGGVLAAISLMFMGVSTLACIFFSVVDVSMLENLFERNRGKMAAALRG